MFWGGGIPNKQESSEQINKNENIELAIYLNETETSEIPSYTSGYLFDEEASICTSDATIRWDNETWSPIIQNIENYPVRCEIHFTSYCETHKEEGACKILAKGETDELKFDRTKDNNLRYVGSDPNNYVSFNNELWRIIGVMNNMELEDGTKGVSLLKLIRSESIGTYSWDNKTSGIGSSNSEWGSNDWSDSRLMMLLNPGYETPNSPIYEYEGSLYYNAKSGTCYSGRPGTTVSCDFTETGLKSDEVKNMIARVIWKLGGVSSSTNIASVYYALERGTAVYEGRPATWIGSIALIYPSDYGYATSGGSTTNRETCLNTPLSQWRNISDCYNNNWLNHNTYNYWTLTHNNEDHNVVYNAIDIGGFMGNNASAAGVAVLPSLYLSSNVKIVSGTGSMTDPYILELS